MAKAMFPIYVSVGGALVQAGVWEVEADERGICEISLTGMATALREAADRLDEQAKEIDSREA